MANIIRCVLPDCVRRFKPFTLADYEDFLLLRNHMESLPEIEDHEVIVNELLEDCFPEYPPHWRPYLFVKVFSGSIGKTKLELVYKCPVCEFEHKKILNIAQDDFKEPELTIGNVTLKFKIPEVVEEDVSKAFLNNIKECVIDDISYKWDELDSSITDQIMTAIDFSMIESIVDKLYPINFKVKFHCKQTEKCKDVTKQTVAYRDITALFKLLLTPDEIFNFYDINHTLVKANYDYASLMSMMPAKRNMILSYVERDKKNDSKTGLS